MLRRRVLRRNVKFRELPNGELFTVSLDHIHHVTAIKLNEKTAIRLDNGERIDVHHNRNVDGIITPEAESAVGVLGQDVVLYAPAHQNQFRVHHVLVLRSDYVPKSAIQQAKPQFVKKEVDKSIQGLIDKLCERTRQAQNLLAVLKDSVCDIDG